MTEQEHLKAEYERQQTIEGQAALHVKRELLKRFRDINGVSNLNVGEVHALKDSKTGEIKRYFKAL